MLSELEYPLKSLEDVGSLRSPESQPMKTEAGRLAVAIYKLYKSYD